MGGDSYSSGFGEHLGLLVGDQFFFRVLSFLSPRLESPQAREKWLKKLETGKGLLLLC